MHSVLNHRDDQLAPHFAKMAHSYLWIGNNEMARFYAGSLKTILDRRPQAKLRIHDRHMRRYAHLLNCMEDEIDPRPWRTHNRDQHGSVMLPAIPKSEKDIQDMLLADPSLFAHLCGRPEVIRHEVKVGCGKADIDFVIDRMAHVIELKFVEAGHEVVGQIEKYMRAIGSKVHYGIYDDVTGWVMAPSFHPETVVSLKHIGVRMVTLHWPKFA